MSVRDVVDEAFLFLWDAALVKSKMKRKDLKMNMIWLFCVHAVNKTKNWCCWSENSLNHDGNLTLKLNVAGPVATRRLKVGT